MEVLVVSNDRTADYTTTYPFSEMIDDNANENDIVDYLTDGIILADELTLRNMASMMLKNLPSTIPWFL